MPVKEQIEGVIIGVLMSFEERIPLVVYLRKPEKLCGSGLVADAIWGCQCHQ